MKKILVVSLLIVFGFSLNAQDIHFSQFYMAPLTLNPAMTGVNNCKARLVANYRNQWSSVLKEYAYNTYSASYDQRFPVGRSDYFAAGMSFWGDKAGHGDFKTLQARLSGSYSKKMAGSRKTAHYLVIGGDVGLTQRSVDFQALLFGDQYNNGGEPGETGEIDFSRTSFLFADITAGVLWFSVFDDNKNLYFGGSYAHINQANLSFTDINAEELFSKFTIHFGGEFPVASRLALVPGVVSFLQGPHFEVNAGTAFKFILGKYRNSYESFHFGVWTRIGSHYTNPMTGDAVILSTRFEYDNYNIGFSYDLNISSLKKVSHSNGAFEFSMIYNICGPETRNPYCPRF